MADIIFKRILILGQSFNNYSGGGITLSNLFKGWPNDKIAVTSTGHSLDKRSIDVCNIYYQLGREEQSWRFPFRILQKSFPSGLRSDKSQGTGVQVPERRNIRKTIVDNIFFPCLHWLGLFHGLSKISLSPGFKEWLSVYKPEILYLQVSTRELINFSIQLSDYLNIPTAIHMMDDWPSTISRNGLLKKYWRGKIDKEFRQLLDRTDLSLSISEAMSSEYEKRYSRVFYAFHNPIDTSKFTYTYNNINKTDKTFRILYLGRIGVANKNSIYTFAKTISSLKIDQNKVLLDIFTCDFHSRYIKGIEKLRNVKISPPVSHNSVPELLSRYDLLFLPLDFTKTGIKFARLSIPTKASEYLVSGTPVLVYAPEEMAITQFCIKNNCGYCVTDQSQEKIKEALQFLIINEEYRLRMSSKAVLLAKELFDSNKVRNEFQQLLIKTSKRQNYV